MPSDGKKRPSNKRRVAFLADRMAILMVELISRDCEYGLFCYDEFYKDELAEKWRESQYYDTALDFVRNMLRRFDENERTG